MLEVIIPVIMRFLRGLIAILIAGIIATYAKSEYWLVIAPILNALAKWLRVAYGWDIKVL